MSDFKNIKSESAEFEPVKRDGLSLRNCPVAVRAGIVLETSEETIKALQSLRQSLLNCEFCPAFEKCELREQFNNQVNQVISEINEEWGW